MNARDIQREREWKSASASAERRNKLWYLTPRVPNFLYRLCEYLSVHTSTHNSHASSPRLGSYSAPTHNTIGLREWRRVCACVSVMNRASGILLVLLYTAGLRARSLVKSASQVLSRFSKEMTLEHHRKCYRQNDLLSPGDEGAGRGWIGGEVWKGRGNLTKQWPQAWCTILIVSILGIFMYKQLMLW